MSGARRVARFPVWLLAVVLPAAAAAQTESIVGSLPVAGSTRGAQGSDFKTSLRILNPNPDPIAGRIVFHPAGRSADAADPSIEYALAPQESESFDDVAETIGVTGIGSLDLTVVDPPPSYRQPPIVVARIFNDAGAAGTSGFTVPLFVPRIPLAVPGPPVLGHLLGPIASGQFRFNVGVLNLGDAVGLTVDVIDPSGAVLHTVTREYPALFFQQTTAVDFTGGFTLENGESIRISPSSAQVIVYGATVDNVTNDPSAQFLSYWYGASPP